MKTVQLFSLVVLFAGCGDLPCMKSYKLHFKANLAQTAAEKEYYEKQAEIYDRQCAQYNEQEFQVKQQQELHKHKP
jgi:hypothetical protein